MKAIVFTKYGPPEVLQLRDVEKPVPKENEVLIKIHAAAVNTGDCEIRRFDINILFWLFLRIAMGILKPRGTKILGQEVSGVIEAIGKDVTQFTVGDSVMAQTGFTFGGYAEYVCLSTKNAMVIKPQNISWEQASAVPVGGANALHFLRKANIQAGQKVLIYGSTGSIGTLAVQLAKYYGAEVSAICSTSKIELVKSLGADHIIDYKKEDFTKNGELYDVIFDTIGGSPFTECVSSLKDNGVFLIANPKVFEMVRAIWISKTSSKKVMFEFADSKTEDLLFLKKLIEDEKLNVVVDEKYFTLEQTIEAHYYVEKRHKTGNVVLRIVSDL